MLSLVEHQKRVCIQRQFPLCQSPLWHLIWQVPSQWLRLWVQEPRTTTLPLFGPKARSLSLVKLYFLTLPCCTINSQTEWKRVQNVNHPFSPWPLGSIWHSEPQESSMTVWLLYKHEVSAKSAVFVECVLLVGILSSCSGKKWDSLF